MKYLVVLLLLSGCSSAPVGISEYRQGCLDGIIQSIEMNDDNFGKFLLDKPENVELVKKNIDKYTCLPLDSKRSAEVPAEEQRHPYPKNR